MIRKENKNICLTFDYELFFKKSGTLDNCIINPVDLLIKHLKKYSIQATFFIDILYYVKLLENKKFKDDVNKIKFQLQNLIYNGHRIELHIHTSWVDAEFDGIQWRFPPNHRYRLHDFDIGAIMDFFSIGTNTLNSIAQEVNPNYKISAFRAGGWCIQPFDKIFDAFKENNLFIDSSVARNMYFASSSHRADFLQTPKFDIYNFSRNPLEIDKRGCFFEIPISTYNKSISEKIFYKLNTLTSKKEDNIIFGDGIGLSSNHRSFFDKYFSASKEMFSLECSDEKFLIEKVRQYNFKNVVFISHPKGLSLKSFNIIDILYNEGYTFNEMVSLIERRY